MLWLHFTAFLNADVCQIFHCFKILKTFISRFVYYLLEICPLITGRRCSNESDTVACGARYVSWLLLSYRVWFPQDVYDSCEFVNAGYTHSWEENVPLKLQCPSRIASNPLQSLHFIGFNSIGSFGISEKLATHLQYLWITEQNQIKHRRVPSFILPL